MTSHKKMITNLRSFSFGFYTNHNTWSFLNNTSHFEIGAWNFYISILRMSLWFFKHHIFQFKMSFSFFPSQILICATDFCSSRSLFHFEINIWWALLQKHKNKVGRYIGTSLCKYQDHQDHWPIIHDKLEDLFAIIIHSLQDFSHKKKCAYITS